MDVYTNILHRPKRKIRQNIIKPIIILHLFTFQTPILTAKKIKKCKINSRNFTYDGRIKYLHKKCIYVNIISKNDYRYNIIETKINNKMNLIKNFNIRNNGLKFYIDIYYKNYELGLIFSKKML